MKASETTPQMPVELKMEVLALPVADVDRSKTFYTRLGWRLDADFTKGNWRVVQMTPPGSATSVIFGKGFTSAAPGSMQGTFLVVEDLAAARQQVVAADVKATEIFHFAGGLNVSSTDGRVAGFDPSGESYRSFFAFNDPDGNSYLVQEIKTRLPGRGVSSIDVDEMTTFLREAEKAHGAYEAKAPKHHWSDWYAPYIVARQRGKTEEEAVRAANEAATSH